VLIFVHYSFIYPVVKVIGSHVSKIQMASHEWERNSYFYSATVGHKLSKRLSILIEQPFYIDWIYGLRNSVKKLVLLKGQL
jgi:hypothetical protein